MVRIGLLLLIMAMFLGLSGQVIYAYDMVVEENAPVEIAPDFTLNNLSGDKVSLSSFKGKGVILFFWASWCPHCRTELSALGKEYSTIKSSGIELLSINIDEPKNRVEEFLKKYSVQYPVLMDKGGEVAQSYNVVGIPTLVFISGEGKVVLTGQYLPPNYRELLQVNQKESK